MAKGDTRSLTFLIDGGGSALQPAAAVRAWVDFAFFIKGVTLIADRSGSVQLDVQVNGRAGWPTTESIVASAPPTITNTTQAQDTTLAGWTTDFSHTSGMGITVSVTSATTIQQVACTLKLQEA